MNTTTSYAPQVPWNKNKVVGQKLPLKLKQIASIRKKLELANKVRDLALFNLGIDSKLRGCDLVSITAKDVCNGASVKSSVTVVETKTGLPVEFELTESTRKSVLALVTQNKLSEADYLFKSRIHASNHISTRQFARIVDEWIVSIGLDKANYGTHTIRRTLPSLTKKKTKNVKAK